MTIRSVLRSVFRVNRSSLVGAFVIVALATALLTASGAWIEAGWTADGADNLDMLSALGSSFAGTTLIIVVFIVASTVATALRGRRREFALLRSIGATAAQVRIQVTAEVLVVVLAAAPVGVLAGALIAPALTPLLVSNGIVPAGFALAFSPLPILATLIVLVPTALLAARLAARESAKLSPTSALRQSETEPAEISRGRLITALMIAVAGVLVATTPLFISGPLGTAAGASSALLLIVAVALAGPVMIGGVAARAATATVSGTHAAVALAAVNARGFSRRHTAVILPLALLLSLGTVQSGVGVAMTEGGARQLEQAVTADLVVPSGAMAGGTDSISEVPGVISTAHLSAIRGSVHVDADEGVPIWEPTAIRTLSPADSGLLDPGVIDGSLPDLAAEGTIAVSRDAILFTGKGVGDSIGVRLSGEAETTMRIVAVYERSLGIGDYLVSPRAAEFETASTAVLVHTGRILRTLSWRRSQHGECRRWMRRPSRKKPAGRAPRSRGSPTRCCSHCWRSSLSRRCRLWR